MTPTQKRGQSTDAITTASRYCAALQNVKMNEDKAREHMLYCRCKNDVVSLSGTGFYACTTCFTQEKQRCNKVLNEKDCHDDMLL